MVSLQDVEEEGDDDDDDDDDEKEEEPLLPKVEGAGVRERVGEALNFAEERKESGRVASGPYPVLWRLLLADSFEELPFKSSNSPLYSD